MNKKARQAFVDVFYKSVTDKIDTLAGENANDSLYMSGFLSNAIMELIRDHGRDVRAADFLLATFDNLLEDKATVLVYPLAAQALSDARKFKAGHRMIHSLEVFMHQDCMVAAKPAPYKLAVPNLV